MIRVLVVEDSPTSRAFLVETLQREADIQVAAEASLGQRGVELASEIEPDLIVMDVSMPDMDGLEATRRIMARRRIPILIVTAHANSSEMDVVFEAMKAGAVDVLPKPTADQEHTPWQLEFVQRVRRLAAVEPRPAPRVST